VRLVFKLFLLVRGMFFVGFAFCVFLLKIVVFKNVY